MPAREKRFIELMGLFGRDITAKLQVFLRTSTLDDQLDPGTAEAVFSLGRYVAIAHEQRILRHLQEASNSPTGRQWCSRQ